MLMITIKIIDICYLFDHSHYPYSKKEFPNLKFQNEYLFITISIICCQCKIINLLSNNFHYIFTGKTHFL